MNKIRLTESTLRQMVKESVSKVLKEDLRVRDVYQSNRPKKGSIKREYAKYEDVRDTVLDLKQSLRHVEDLLFDIYSKSGRRISADYAEKLHGNIVALQKAFSDDSPLMTSFANQKFNPWKAQGYGRNTTYSPIGGNKNINGKGQVVLYNPITKRMEGFTNPKAIKVMKQMFDIYDPDNEDESWYVDGDALAHPDGGAYVRKSDLDNGSVNNPIEALRSLVRDEEGEPDDWYERNEHGDFDTY